MKKKISEKKIELSEGDIRVILWIDYENKRFAIFPNSGDKFNFGGPNVADNVIAVANLIRNAAEFAKIELEEPKPDFWHDEQHKQMTEHFSAPRIIYAVAEHNKKLVPATAVRSEYNDGPGYFAYQMTQEEINSFEKAMKEFYDNPSRKGVTTIDSKNIIFLPVTSKIISNDGCSADIVMNDAEKAIYEDNINKHKMGELIRIALTAEQILSLPIEIKESRFNVGNGDLYDIALSPTEYFNF